MNPRRPLRVLACTIVRISLRMSADTLGRPMRRRLLSHHSRNSRRCHAMNAPMFAASEDGQKRVSIAGRNINCGNENGLFGRATLPPAMRIEQEKDYWRMEALAELWNTTVRDSAHGSSSVSEPYGAHDVFTYLLTTTFLIDAVVVAVVWIGLVVAGKKYLNASTNVSVSAEQLRASLQNSLSTIGMLLPLIAALAAYNVIIGETSHPSWLVMAILILTITSFVLIWYNFTLIRLSSTTGQVTLTLPETVSLSSPVASPISGSRSPFFMQSSF